MANKSSHFKLVNFLFVLIFFSPKSWATWDPDMPGGMKLVIDGDTYSFTTDACSGGIFFKRPVHIQMKCLHGYFLNRPNGCFMEGSTIIGGQNYVCQHVSQDESDVIQALIPLTNPDRPLDHTITMFDDANTLRNLRRYTYVKGLEEGYDDSTVFDPVGVIVTNTQKTPQMSIEKICYEGKRQNLANSYMASVLKDANTEYDTSNKLFRVGCDESSIPFPWGRENVYNFTQGYSNPIIFDSEIPAELPKYIKGLPHDATQSMRAEIWGGLAYCLQADSKITKDGKIQMKGLEPSIQTLGFFCPPKTSVEKYNRTLRRQNARKKRGLQSSPEFDTLMACVSTCWKDNPDKCHESPPPTFTLPICPPYCGGKPRQRLPPPMNGFRWG